MRVRKKLVSLLLITGMITSQLLGFTSYAAVSSVNPSKTAEGISLFGSTTAGEFSFAGSITSCVIASNKADINISGAISQSYLKQGTTVALYELPTYADEFSADYSALTPLIPEKEATSSFNYTVSLKNGDNTRLLSKFVVVLKSDSGYKLVDCGKYITNPEILAENTDSYPVTKSIKGLQVQNPADAERLGVQHAAINISYNDMLTKTDHGSATIQYNYNGETYYFSKNVINSIDSQVRSLTENKMSVTAILLAYPKNLTNSDSVNRDIIHPDADLSNGTVYAFNTKNEIGVKYIGAITDFLANRYSSTDKSNGRINGYIVGNEIGQNKVWNNMGQKDVVEYVIEHERTLRLIYNIVKSHSLNARVYISMDHFWNAGNKPDSKWEYDNKLIVYLLNKIIKYYGDFGWNMAFHPYPENLFNPRTWADKTATKSFDSYRITFKNIEILSQFLEQDEYKYNGQARRIILSEQGFNSAGNTQQEQNIQAAAYAYAYYKVKSIPTIDAFILHRHVDHMDEGGLMLGLWTCVSGEKCEAGTQKKIYDIFRRIDTVDSLSVTEFAKAIIGQSSWDDIIDDPFEPEKRPAQARLNAGITMNAPGTISLDDFESGLNNWAAAENITKVSLVDTDKNDGSYSLKADVIGSFMDDYKGVTKTFTTPKDLSSTPVITVAVKPVGMPAGYSASVMIRAYDDANDMVCEGEGVVSTGVWTTVGLNMTGWAGISNITRVKVWAKPDGKVRWSSGSLYVDDLSATPTADFVNISVELSKPAEVKVNDNLSVKVTNNGTKALSQTMTITPLNGMTVDKQSVNINIAPGETYSFNIKVTGLDIDLLKSGQLKLNIGTLYESTFEIVNVRYLYYTTEGSDIVFATFEGGATDGFKAGAYTNFANPSIRDTKSPDGNNPKTVYNGSYMLECEKSPTTNALTDSWVVKTFNKPIDLSNYSFITLGFFGWAGTSSGYTLTLRLTASDNTTKDYTWNVDNSKWNDVFFDISDFGKLDSIKSISFAYRGNDLKYHAGNWNGGFYLDEIRARKNAVTNVTTPKANETLRVGEKMKVALYAYYSSTSPVDVSAASNGTTYTGYDESIISVSPDGLITAKAPGLTTLYANHEAFNVPITINVKDTAEKPLFGFEGSAEGWIAVSNGNIERIAVESGNYHGMATNDKGNYGLVVHMAGVAPDSPKIIQKAFAEPLNLTGFKALNYKILTWGGLTPAGAITYQVTTIFKSTDGSKTMQSVNSIAENSFRLVSIDLSKCDFIDDIGSIEISYSALNSNIPAWGGKFYIDDMYLTY